MTLETLQKEMVAAMKNKDKARKDTISALIGNIKTAAINENCRNDIPEELVDRIILKEKKTVQEMIDTCPADRTETLAEYTQRMKVIDEFAPHMMNEDEVRAALYNIIDNVDSVQLGKGAIMKIVMPKLKGKADGKIINKIVSEIVAEANERN